MTKQIRLSGSGGQGIITIAIIFAKACVKENKNVVQSQSYGPEARGGASKAEIIISDNTIYHPKVTRPDIVVALTQKSADKYYSDLDLNTGLLIIDEDLVPNPPKFPNIIKVPITRLATKHLGNTIFTNIIALGILAKASQIISLDTIKSALISHMPKHTIDKNLSALELGFSSI